MKQGNEAQRKTSNDSNQTYDTSTTSKLSSSFDSDYSLDSTSLHHHHQQQSISISLSDNSCSKDKPVIRKPLVLPKPRSRSVSSKENYDIPCPSSTTNNNINKKRSVLDEEDIPAGYDPIEYDYLMNEQNQEDSTNDLPFGLLSRSTKSASNGSLVSIFFHHIIFLFIVPNVSVICIDCGLIRN